MSSFSSDLRDIGIIARHDWLDALRSRRIVVWFILYLSGAIVASLIFANILQGIETEIAKTMGLSGQAKAGALISEIWKKPSFRSFMMGLVQDPDLLDKLIATPPFALFYGGLSFMFTPLLVIILSSEAIASETASGYVRFNAIRTHRMSWIFGKMLAHSLLFLAALACSAVGAMIIGALKLAHFELWTSLPFYLEFLLKSWVYSLPFLGIAFAVSQCTRSPNFAKVLGLMVLFTISLVAGYANYHTAGSWERFWELCLMVLPQGHRMDLWLPDISKNLVAGAYSVGLSVLYAMMGYAVYSRRDL